MKQAPIDDVKQAFRLYEQLSGIVATINAFYPFEVEMRTSVQILSQLLDEMERLPSLHSDVTRHEYVLALLREMRDVLPSRGEKPDRKRELLFLLYLASVVACERLENVFGCAGERYSQFPSHAEAILCGWTLGGQAPMSKTAEQEIREKIVRYYRDQGIELSGKHDK
jgi:hypothetical protein